SPTNVAVARSVPDNEDDDDDDDVQVLEGPSYVNAAPQRFPVRQPALALQQQQRIPRNGVVYVCPQDRAVLQRHGHTYGPATLPRAAALRRAQFVRPLYRPVSPVVMQRPAQSFGITEGRPVNTYHHVGQQYLPSPSLQYCNRPAVFQAQPRLAQSQVVRRNPPISVSRVSPNLQAMRSQIGAPLDHAQRPVSAGLIDRNGQVWPSATAAVSAATNGARLSMNEVLHRIRTTGQKPAAGEAARAGAPAGNANLSSRSELFFDSSFLPERKILNMFTLKDKRIVKNEMEAALQFQNDQDIDDEVSMLC
ncbi:unnamed protein product, partial [Gongylonema pulchrum]|uniref:NET domain-containing protein n=1 Tax=Gongylonema pulchrum TaxID=637853 RepID=A0A183D7K2_9BILA